LYATEIGLSNEVECYKGVVHPWLCDMMGHMTTRHYTAMFDDASYHMLAALGFTPAHLHAGIGFADVKHTTSFLSELTAGALIAVTGRVIRVGGKSLTTHFRLTDIHSGREAAKLESIAVQFDLKARRAIDLLPEIRERASQLL
jgi:acyl-CoA thioester hydrolase